MPKFDPKTEYIIAPKTINIEDFHKYGEEYVVRPPYQRKTVWSRYKQQSLLDSLFRRYYIPRIVIRKVRLGDDQTINEVIDGQQRITTVQNFYDGTLALPKTLKDINPILPGKHYNELSSDFRRFVDRIAFHADLVTGIDDPKNPDHQKIATEIFWRLQQGESLNYMEVAHSRLSSLARNFVVKYGDDQRFNYDRYEPIDGNPDKHDFFKIISRGNNRMQHLGLLSRFLLIEKEDGPADLKNSNVAKYIDDSKTRDGIDNWSMEEQPQAKQVLRNMKMFYEVFKDDPLVINGGRGMKEFRDEYVIISFYLLLRHLRRHYVLNARERKLVYEFALNFIERLRGARRSTVRDLLIFSDHRQQSAAEIEIRHRILRQDFFTYATSNGQGIRAKDDRRIFSEAQRIEIYRRDNGYCQKCLEEDKPQKEALVPWSEYEADHVIPHSRGGATEVENAQVLCRYHNRLKGAAVSV